MPDDSAPANARASTALPTDNDGGIEAYETDDGVVLYDATNPLAWIESRRPVALDDAT